MLTKELDKFVKMLYVAFNFNFLWNIVIVQLLNGLLLFHFF